jgi:hypothetical protein
MNKKIAVFLAISVMSLSGCAAGKAVRTSASTMMVTVSAAPACGGIGAADYAAKFAAIETIKAGFDGYVIAGGAAQNNVKITALPGTANTTGVVTGNMYSEQTTYTPGPIIPMGSHDQQLSIKMFKRGEAGFSDAVDARQVLGPDWEELVKNGKNTCG